MISTRVSTLDQPDFRGAVDSRALAEILRGCWRAEPLPASLDAAHLSALSPVLRGAGVGALAWRRLRHSALAQEPAAQDLGRLHLKQALDAQVQARQVERVFGLLNGEGIRALLFKGWASARVYPQAGLRPVGDIDLLIDPANKTATERLLGVRVDDDRNALWDIKTQVPAIYQLDAEALFARQERVPLGEVEVSIPGAEDQLRVLCLHFLKHGAWRPLWACDIAAALEARPAGFNWELCLGEDARLGDVIACALGVAHQLLGASVAGTPAEGRAARLPTWLVPAVLREWETPQNSQHQPDALLLEALRVRRGAVEAVRRRWPNPIQSAMEWKIPLSFPPLPAQTASLLAMSLFFFKRSGRSPRD